MGKTIVTIDPSTGDERAHYDAMDDAAIEHAVGAAFAAVDDWGGTPVDARAALLRRLAEVLRSASDPLAQLMTGEMGKPITESRAEVEKCAWACEYYAAEGPEVLADEPVDTGSGRSWITCEPLGVVLAVMPWNFPLWQVIRFAAPTLLSGNSALLKHAPGTTGTSLEVARLIGEAGFPPDVLQSLLIAEDDVAEVTAGLLADPRVAAVSVTGSSRAGSAVASAAGRNLKPSLLELGGSDPFIVLSDANLDAAVRAAVASRYLNAGQSCLAAKRFIVARELHEEFCDRLVDAVRNLVVGDPAEEATQIGPLARADLRDALAEQVRTSAAAGATIRTGGRAPERNGWWYEPTVLTDVTTGHPVMEAETFGPVAAVIAVDDDDEAVRIANATPYGLGAGIWTADTDRGKAVGRRITSGALFINAVVASDPRLPFGGTKQSGYGRELGHAGLGEFVNVRTWHLEGAT